MKVRRLVVIVIHRDNNSEESADFRHNKTRLYNAEHPQSIRFHTNSIITLRPTIAAARCKLDNVISFLASNNRSTWVRLVLSRAAIFFFDRFFFFIALANCQATTSLTACDCASSNIPSSLRKLSMLEPKCFLLIDPTPSCVVLPNPSLPAV